MRYVNEGVTLGAVNVPEVNLRSLTLEDPNSVRVIFVHKNVPGVLGQGKDLSCLVVEDKVLTDDVVNRILVNHNIEKQMSDSRGEVCWSIRCGMKRSTNVFQVAYLMADISDVKEAEIKDLYQSLEDLSGKCISIPLYPLAGLGIR